MTAGAPRVLIVDDDDGARAVVRAVLEIAGFEIAGEAASGIEALGLLELAESAPSAVVVDHRMPGLTGLETAQRLLAAWPNQIIILFSAGLTDDLVTQALNAGVLQCIDKIDVKRLAPVLHTLLGTQKWTTMRDRSGTE